AAEVQAKSRGHGPGGTRAPKEGTGFGITAGLCLRFRRGYLHFEREVWPGRMTQTILEIIDGGLVFFLRAQQAGKAIRGQGKARINRQRFLEFVAGLLELPQILKGPPKCVVGLERIRLRAEDDAEFVSSSLWRVILQERKRKLVADFVPIGVAGQCCLKGGDRTAKLSFASIECAQRFIGFCA